MKVCNFSGPQMGENIEQSSKLMTNTVAMITGSFEVVSHFELIDCHNFVNNEIIAMEFGTLHE